MNKLEKIKYYLKSIPQNIECGHHSNFRWCCVLDFSVFDHFNYFFCPKAYRTKRYINRIILKLRKKKFGYIPCPVCVMLREPRKVYACRDLPHKWLMSRDEIRKYTNHETYDILCENLSKIDQIMKILLDQ